MDDVHVNEEEGIISRWTNEYIKIYAGEPRRVPSATSETPLVGEA
jgi:hypothetical protein